MVYRDGAVVVAEAGIHYCPLHLRVHPPPLDGTGATTAALDAEAGDEEERGHTQASLKGDNMDIFTLAFRAYFEPNAPLLIA